MKLFLMKYYELHFELSCIENDCNVLVKKWKTETSKSMFQNQIVVEPEEIEAQVDKWFVLISGKMKDNYNNKNDSPLNWKTSKAAVYIANVTKEDSLNSKMILGLLTWSNID